jgi:hypothetical protein
MESPVYYHHPDDERYSIDFVNTDWSQIENRISRYDTETPTKVETYELNETVHVIYTAGGIDGPADELEYNLDAQFAKMTSSADRVIARYYFSIFRGVMEQNVEEESERLKAYKKSDFSDIPTVLNRVRWEKRISEAGGTLLSNLILNHALPNANHRTAFGMLESLLECSNPDFRMPSLATDDFDWQQWVDPYILDSKRLLTVRRNTTRFKILREAGCEVIKRKGGINISIQQYELDMHPTDALEQYAEEHEDRSVEFVHQLLDRSDFSNFGQVDSPTKQEFADWLKQKD